MLGSKNLTKLFNNAYFVAMGVVLLAVLITLLILRASSLGIIIAALFVGAALGLVWAQVVGHRGLVITLIVLGVLAPAIPIPGVWRIRPEELVVFLLVPAIIMRLRGGWTTIDIGFSLMAVSIFISMAWGTMVMGMDISLRDAMEYVKLIKYWLFFRLAIFPWDENDIDIILRWLMASMLVAGIVGFLQWNNLMGLGNLALRIYSDTGGIEDRLIGTAANPNDFAMLAITGFAFTLSIFTWFRPKWLLFVVASFQILSVMIVSSRSGALSIAIVTITVAVLYLMKTGMLSRRRWFRWILAGLIVILAATCVLGPMIAQEVQYVNSLSGIALIEYVNTSQLNTLFWRLVSWRALGLDVRMDNWIANWDEYLRSPILGWGPGKFSQSAIVDNQYIFYLRRYGIVGQLIYLYLFWQVFRVGWGLAFRRSSPQMVSLGIAFIAVNLSYLLVNMFIYTYYNLQLMSIFWLMVGVSYAILRYSSPKSPGTGLSKENKPWALRGV